MHSNHRHLPKSVVADSLNKIQFLSPKEEPSSSSPQRYVVKSRRRNHSPGEKTIRKPLIWSTLEEVSDV